MVNVLEELIPRAVHIRLWDSDRDLPIASVLDEAAPQGVVYYLREGEAPAPYQHQVQQGLMSVQVTETPQTETLRAAHLRAKGYVVLLCRRREYTYEQDGNTQSWATHDADLVSAYCQERGLRFVAVRAASAEESGVGSD